MIKNINVSIGVYIFLRFYSSIRFIKVEKSSRQMHLHLNFGVKGIPTP